MAGTGWYNDVHDPALARWYDGEGWTEHVVVKAHWEAAGHPPPPPVESMATAPSRLRQLAASAVVVALLVIVGFAMVRDDGGDGEGNPTVGRSGSEARLGGDGPATSDPGVDSSSPVFSIEPDRGGDTPTSSNGTTRTSSATTRTSAQTTTRSDGVTRTERRSSSHVDPGPVNEVGSGDKTSVGNTNDRSIKEKYEPPSTTSSTGSPTTVADPTTSTSTAN